MRRVSNGTYFLVMLTKKVRRDGRGRGEVGEDKKRLERVRRGRGEVGESEGRWERARGGGRERVMKLVFCVFC